VAEGLRLAELMVARLGLEEGGLPLGLDDGAEAREQACVVVLRMRSDVILMQEVWS
jgi:hypothetical protein